MQIYLSINEKGGVGKTTLTVNLAAAFAHSGARVLVIDLDGQAHATQLLLDAPVPNDKTVLAAIEAGRPLGNAIQIGVRDKVAVVGSNAQVGTRLPQVLAGLDNNGLFAFAAMLEKPAEIFDVCIMDMAPARSLVHGAALATAHRCIVPVQPEELVLSALPRLAQSITAARRVNTQLREATIIRNRFAPRSTIRRLYAEQLSSEAFLTQHQMVLLPTIVPERATIEVAAAHHTSVFALTGGDAAEVQGIFLAAAGDLLALDETSVRVPR